MSFGWLFWIFIIGLIVYFIIKKKKRSADGNWRDPRNQQGGCCGKEDGTIRYRGDGFNL